ncbi:MAG TPA: translocation/assembly module TamB domain-containing protein [Candidatus Saccharicenans sp.]|nr:translocation/assembly module TamB domain-containing protein [Candidatus Saccharicenans sp.]
MTDGKLEGKKHRLPRGLKIAIWVIGLILACLLVVVLLVSTPPGGRLILNQAEKWLETSAGYRLEAGSLKINLFRLKVTLTDFRLQSIAPGKLPSGTIDGDRLAVQVAWSTLTGGPIRIKNLEIERPRVSLQSGQQATGVSEKKPEDGSLSTPPADQATKSLSLRLDHFLLENGVFSYEDEPGQLTFNLNEIEASIKFDPSKNSHLVGIQAGKGQLQLGQGPLDLNSLKLKAEVGQQKINIENLSLVTAESEILASGEINDYLGQPVLNLTSSARINLAEINAVVGPPGYLAGLISWDLKASGEARAPQLSGQMAGSDLKFMGLSGVRLTAALEPGDNSSLRFKAGVSLGSGSIGVEAKLPPALKGDFSGRIDFNKFPLKEVAILWPDRPVTPDCLVDGYIEMAGPEINLEKIKARSELYLQVPEKDSVLLASSPLLPLSGNIKASLADKEITVSDFNLQGLETNLSLKAKVADLKKISGQLSFKIDELSRTINSLQASGLDRSLPALAASLNDLPNIKGALELEARVSGTLDRPEFELDLATENLFLKNLSLPAVKIKAGGNLDKLDLKQLTIDFEQGKISASGHLARSSGRPSAPLRLQAQVELNKINLAQLADFLGESYKSYLNGYLSGSASASGYLNAPQAQFNLTVEKPQLQNLPMDLLHLSGVYANEEIKLDELLLAWPGGQIAGRLGFRPSSGEIMADLSGEKLKASYFSSLLPALSAGELDFKLVASGSYLAPVADLKLVAQGLMLGQFWFPYVEFGVKADGQKALANFSVPRFNLNLTAQLDLAQPYLLTGLMTIKDLPLANLAGMLPTVEEEVPEVAITANLNFSLPLSKPEEVQAEFIFENFDFAGLTAFLPSLKEMNPGGGANGSIRLNGFTPDLSATSLEVKIPELNLTLNNIPVKSDGALSFHLKDKILAVDNFTLLAPHSRIKLSGQSEIKEFSNPGLDFSLSGQLSLEDINPMLSGMSAGGKTEFQASLKGTLQQPLIDGRVDLQQVFFRLNDLPLVVSGVQGKLTIDNSYLQLEKVSGEANSGRFTASGQANFGPSFSLPEARLNFVLEDFDFNYPPGLNSLSRASLTLTKGKSGWLLAGDLFIINASYLEDFYPSTQGLKMVFSRVSPAGSEMSPFLYELALNINVRTVDNIVIKNNLADLELKANLNIKGTIPTPVLSGRAENAYTGEISIGERKYTVERLRVDFLGQENIEPNLDILLKSTVYDQQEELDVSLVLAGTPSDLKFSLTSNPTRSTEDLASLLLTGKSLKEVQGSAINTISGQLIQFFSSPLASPVTRTLEKWLKAEDVVLEPLNIATLQDPGARLTIRKRMTREAAITYSIDLTNSQYQTWIFDYQLNHNFSLRGFRLDDGVVGVNLRHRIPIGGRGSQKSTLTSVARVLEKIEITGETVFPPSQLEKVLKLKPGKKYKSSDWSKALNRLDAFYRKKGYYNYKLTREVETTAEQTDIIRLNIQAGQPVSFKFTGDGISKKIRKKALNSWLSRLPEDANLYQLRSNLLTELYRQNYYRAEVRIEKNQVEDRTEYIIDVKNNGKWKIASFELEGQPVFEASLLQRVFADYFGARAKGLWNLIYDRRVALDLLQYFYEENGYLQAKIRNPVIEEDESKRLIFIKLKIEAGPQSHVAAVNLSGNLHFSQAELLADLELKPGSIFSWPALSQARVEIINKYRGAGFKEVKVEAGAEAKDDTPDYEVKFDIDEGQIYRMAEMEVVGARRTKPSFILAYAGLRPGDPLSLERLAQAQKNLYDTSVFQAVNISSAPLEEDDNNQEKVKVELQENPWLSLTYGLQYNSETHFEGLGQVDFNNLFGRGWNSLLYFRANSKQQEARFSLKVPYIFSKKTDFLLSAYYTKYDQGLYITEETGTSFQQKFMIVKGFNLSWVYKLSRIHDYESEPSWPFPYDVKMTSSELSLLVDRDTRDDRFDPRSGSLLSVSLSYSPRFLGSSLSYVRSFSQYTMYREVGSSLTWASSYRLGLASAFGDTLIPSKRFFAGGGTSIRGFKLDAVGPLDLWTGLPEGGEATVIMNQELRFPIYKMFRGVVFFDAGNVYSRLKDFNPLRLRTGAGFGLRIDTPVGLIRIDYGLNLKPRTGEPRSTIFFSLGQAF